jgi:hypothetical protein
MASEIMDSQMLAALNGLVGGQPGEREELTRQVARMELAAKETGLCGRVRRAVARTREPIESVAESAGIDAMMLQMFLEGTDTLDSGSLDRLVEALGLTVVYDPLAVRACPQ